MTPDGAPRLLFRGDTTRVDVSTVRLREDGSGLLGTSVRSSTGYSGGPSVAFDAAGQVLWTRSLGDLVDVAFVPGVGAFLLKGSLDADTVSELDPGGAEVRETLVEPLRVPPDNLRMQIVRRIDVSPQGDILVSGSTYSQGDKTLSGDSPGQDRRDAHVARLSPQGEIVWEWTMGSPGDDTLQASWGPSDEVMATLVVQYLEEGETFIGGKTIVHRAYRDDLFVTIVEPD